LSDGGADHVELAQKWAKHPLIHIHCDQKKWNPDKKTLICYRQIQDVSIRHGLHFGEPQNDVNYERVSKQSNNTHNKI
jgi:hypothetical protein